MTSSGEIAGATGGALAPTWETLSVRIVVLPTASTTVMVKVFVPTTKFTVLLKLPPTRGTTLLFILTITPVASLTEPLTSMLEAEVVSIQPVAVGVAPRAWRADEIDMVGFVASIVND